MIHEPSIQVDSDFVLQTTHTGERALFADVVLMAIQDCLGISRADGSSNELLECRALAWINNPSMAAQSFEWYCSYLDIDPEIIRNLMNFKKTKMRAAMEAYLEPRSGFYIRKGKS